MIRIIVVRHYKTLNNVNHQIMGWGDSPRIQGWESDPAYVDKTLRDNGILVDAVYSSYLERARQTAMYFARSRDIHVIHDAKALNEVDYGALFGKSKKWVSKRFPGYKTDPDFVHPEGESFRQMQRRSVAFLTSLEPTHAYQTLLVVIHAGVIRGIICHFMGLDLATHLQRKISHRYVGEFTIENGICTEYDELGKASGFLRKGVIEISHRTLSRPNCLEMPESTQMPRPLSGELGEPYQMASNPVSAWNCRGSTDDEG